MLLAMIQIGLLCLILGHGSAAGHVFLIALVWAAINPWTWLAMLGIVSATSDDQ